MAYKEKTCPKCGVTHNKRGEFCSRSCGNSRALTPQQKKKIGEKKSLWLRGGSDEAEVAKHNFVSGGNNKTPDPVPPVVRKNIPDNSFVQDGDLWTEV